MASGSTHHAGRVPATRPAGQGGRRRRRADPRTDQRHGGLPRGVREHDPHRGHVPGLAGGDRHVLRAGDPAFHHADRVQADDARRLRAGAVRAVEQDRVPGREGAGQRGVLRHQGAGAGGDRRHRHRPVRRVPGRAGRTLHRPRAGHHAGVPRAAGARDLRAGYRHRPGVRFAAARRRCDGGCHARRGRYGCCGGRGGHGCRWCRRGRCAHDARRCPHGRRRRTFDGIDRQQREVGLPGRFRRCWRWPQGRGGGSRQRRPDRRAVGRAARGRRCAVR